MISRGDTATGERSNLWTDLAAPLPEGVISWRQDGRPMSRDGKFYARFVCYIEANTVRERLDAVVPGEWDLTMELLPSLAKDENEDPVCSFKARLQVLGVVREDVGQGRDYKQAATDAFKRASVRFGIGHELYSMDQLWVQVDSDGKFAKPLEDPSVVYARKNGKASEAGEARSQGQSPQPASATPPASAPSAPTANEPACPKCGSAMWNNRLNKTNPKAPDYKCRSRSCDGVIWPTRNERKDTRSPAPDGYDDDRSDLPF